jgi:thiamine pyrophosphokinase
LNGFLPNAEFFNVNLPIIAADGAANTLMSMNIKPEIVIGDLDSIEPRYLEQLATHYHYVQNFCDFQKALFYLQEQKLLPTIIVGLNGDCLDHVLNNINIFADADNVLYAPPIIGYMLNKNSNRTFILPIDTKISLFGIPIAKASTQGLKWNLHQQQLKFPGKNSSFNRTILEEIVINVHQGKVLVLIYETK